MQERWIRKYPATSITGTIPMQRKSFLMLGLFALAIITSTFAGFAFGYHSGCHANNHATADLPVISVPADYLAGVTPVRYVPNGSFSFDTFQFTNDDGVEMAVPIPRTR
jgi:hypothetical protein